MLLRYTFSIYSHRPFSKYVGVAVDHFVVDLVLIWAANCFDAKNIQQKVIGIGSITT